MNQQNIQSLTTSVGGQASYAVSTEYGVFLPSVRVEWIYQYKNNSRNENIGGAGGPIASRTDSPDRNYFNLGAGITGVFAHGISGFLYYEALLGNNFLSQNTVNAGVSMEY